MSHRKPPGPRYAIPESQFEEGTEPYLRAVADLEAAKAKHQAPAAAVERTLPTKTPRQKKKKRRED